MIEKELALIDQAIESARCRIYRVCEKCGDGESYSHQVKAKNQEDLMKVTIKALSFYRNHIIRVGENNEHT